MLEGSLYTLSEIKSEKSGAYTVEVTLNPAHEVFKGHFPGQPILPGVCLLEMLRDILGETTGLPYRLNKAHTIKYIKPVNPEANPVLRFDINTKEDSSGLLTSASSFLSDGETNFKFRGLFSLEGQL